MARGARVPARGGVAAAAAASRSLVVALMLLWDAVIPDYDTSGALGAAGWPAGADVAGGGRGGFAARAVEGLVSWDAVYFVAVAERGYAYEQEHAFFPLLPLAVRGVAGTLLAPLGAPWGLGWPRRAVLALSGLLVSNTAFVASAVALQRLGERVLGDARAAALAALLYAWGPASVFQSAIYSESLFALLAFAGMLQLEGRGRWAALRAAVLFALAGAARSNGAVLCGFLLHPPARDAVSAILRRHSSAAAGAAAGLARRAALCLVVLAPLGAFQAHGAAAFCGGAWAAAPPAWCGAALPNLYAHVQHHYWGVGLLRYFTPQQAPNFILAAPVLAISAAGVLGYAASDWTRALTIGARCRDGGRGGGGARKAGRGYLSDGALVYVFHWAAMAAVAFLVMHVQVATRFLASCPAVRPPLLAAPGPYCQLYWYCASVASRRGRRAELLWGYSLAYLALGALLHPTFYPWT